MDIEEVKQKWDRRVSSRDCRWTAVQLNLTLFLRRVMDENARCVESGGSEILFAPHQRRLSV